MDQCERCEDMLGSDRDCENCPIGNPCYGCEHYKKDCCGQCGGGK